MPANRKALACNCFWPHCCSWRHVPALGLASSTAAVKVPSRVHRSSNADARDTTTWQQA